MFSKHFSQTQIMIAKLVYIVLKIIDTWRIGNGRDKVDPGLFNSGRKTSNDRSLVCFFTSYVTNFYHTFLSVKY